MHIAARQRDDSIYLSRMAKRKPPGEYRYSREKEAKFNLEYGFLFFFFEFIRITRNARAILYISILWNVKVDHFGVK